MNSINLNNYNFSNKNNLNNQLNILNNLEDNILNDKEDNLEDNLEDNIIKDKLEDKLEDNIIKNKLEDKLEDKLKDKLEDKLKDKLEDKEDKSEDKLEDNIIKDKLEYKLEDKLEDNIIKDKLEDNKKDNIIKDKLEDILEEKIIKYDSFKYKILDIKNLVLSGGGMNGFYIVGVLKLLIEMELLNNVENFYGTSIGSVIILFFTLGYNIKEMMNFIKIFDFSLLIKENIDDIFDNLSFISEEKYKYTLKKIITNRNINVDITLLEYFNINKKNLYITGYNITKNELIIFNHKTHPNIKLWEVMYISSCLPAISQPYKYNEEYYCDGGILNNFPIDIVLDNEIDKTLGIAIKKKNSDPKYINNIIDNLSFFSYHEYLLILISVAFEKDSNKINNPLYNVICIDIDDDTDFANFNLDVEQKIEMLKIGYTMCMNKLPIIIDKIFNNFYNNNKKSIINQYDLII